MIKGNKIVRLLVMYLVVFIVSYFLSNPSQAAISLSGYDFGEVEVGASKTTVVSITNLDDASTTLTGFIFAETTCRDFSIVYDPENMTISSKASLEVEVVYTPSSLGPCSDTLRIFNGNPIPNLVTFSGTGVETVKEEPEPFNARKQASAQIAETINFMKSQSPGSLAGTGKGKSAEERLKSFKKMLVMTAHMIENGKIEEARNKLITIYKKTDGKPDPKDFVQGTAAVELANRIQNLINSLDSI